VRPLRVVLAVVLSWAIALMTAGCGREEPTKPPTPKPTGGGHGGTTGNANHGPGQDTKSTPNTAPTNIK